MKCPPLPCTAQLPKAVALHVLTYDITVVFLVIKCTFSTTKG